jgi:hypothetical protein
MAWKGTVRGNVVVLDESARLPDGARVEVHLVEAGRSPDDPFAALLARRAANAGLRVRMDEIIEEDKREREEHPDTSRQPRTLADAER